VPMKERGARTDEALALFHEVWKNEKPVFHGRFNTVENVYLLPPPEQQPHIPIWIGGSSPQTFRRTAQYGDAWHPNVGSLRRIRESMPVLQEEWQRFGREGEPRVTLRMPCIIGEEREGRRLLGTGSLEQVLEDLEGARELGVEHVVVDFMRQGEVITPEVWNDQFERFASDVLPRFKESV